MTYLQRVSRKEQPTGIWGSGKRNRYLANIDKRAEEMYHCLIKEMADRQGVSEKLKAEQPMERIGKMNSVQARCKPFS